MESSPKMPSDAFWSMVRGNLWRALAHDDEVALMTILTRTARHERMTVSQLLVAIRDHLWWPEDKLQGGLLCAAAGGRTGTVPEGGAVRCAQALLRFPQDLAETETALSELLPSRSRPAATLSRAFGSQRAVMVATLKTHHRVVDNWRRDPSLPCLGDALRR